MQFNHLQKNQLISKYLKMKIIQRIAVALSTIIIAVAAKPLQCGSPIETPENGYTKCSGSSIGSICYFRCEDGYVLEGSKQSQCVLTSTGLKWNDETPKCIRQLTPACNSLPPKPVNGFMECDEGKSFGSMCFFSCNEGYSLIGNEDTLCTETGEHTSEWDLHTPTCVKGCPELDNVENGNRKCSVTEYGHVESCTYNCNDGYQLRPSYNKDLQCLNDGNWNVFKPCCAVTPTCYNSTRADIVIAIDTSTCFGANGVKMAKDFSRDFIDSFSLHHDHTRFSIFRFNSEVDTESQILLFDTAGSRQRLLEDFEKIPSQLEEGLSTGKALNHINDVVLQSQNGDRASVQNIVLLFTGTLSNDDLKSAAIKLKSKVETEVYLIGMEPYPGSFGLEYLESLSELFEDVILVEPGTELKYIDNAIFKAIGRPLCRVEC